MTCLAWLLLFYSELLHPPTYPTLCLVSECVCCHLCGNVFGSRTAIFVACWFCADTSLRLTSCNFFLSIDVGDMELVTNLCLTAGGSTSCCFCPFAKRQEKRDALICHLSLLWGQAVRELGRGATCFGVDVQGCQQGKAAMGSWLASHQVLHESGFITTFCCCLKFSFLPSHHSMVKTPGKTKDSPF